MKLRWLCIGCLPLIALSACASPGSSPRSRVAHAGRIRELEASASSGRVIISDAGMARAQALVCDPVGIAVVSKFAEETTGEPGLMLKYGATPTGQLLVGMVLVSPEGSLGRAAFLTQELSDRLRTAGVGHKKMPAAAVGLSFARPAEARAAVGRLLSALKCELGPRLDFAQEEVLQDTVELVGRARDGRAAAIIAVRVRSDSEREVSAVHICSPMGSVAERRALRRAVGRVTCMRLAWSTFRPPYSLRHR